MAVKNLFSLLFPGKKRTGINRRYLLLSTLLFLIIFSLGSTAFIILMERLMLNNAGQELIKSVELERLKLEASVNSEIAIALKMADSPLIKRYFSHPGNLDLERLAFEEFSAWRAFTKNSVFWINDTDRLFYTDDHLPYLVNPESPENYWYFMTLYETEIYNFNINYNPDLNVTNLWINAPVFNRENKPVGMVGTGINLSDFIDTIYRNYSGNAKLYFFNTAREITGARDLTLVANKARIDDELSKACGEILYRINDLELGGITYIQTKAIKGVAVLGSIPALDWYMVAIQNIGILDSLKTGMTILFSVLMIVMKVVFLSVFTVHESKLAKGRAEAAREAVMSSIKYASKIQKSLLPSDDIFKDTFSDYSIIWKPRDIVGGDIYWIKKFDEGAVLCVCDCTGHGTPGALLTMLVVSAFEAVITENNYKDTADIIWELEKRLVTVLNAKTSDTEVRGINIKEGCDLAVMFIANDKSVIASSSHTHIFICNGKNVRRIKGQKINLGEGKIKRKEDIKTVHFPANPDDKFYIASDGLFEQPGGAKNIPFCYDTFMQIILDNHNENQSVISKKIWLSFEEYRGETPRVDDFELITFKP